MASPLLFLDVDGVLNILEMPAPLPAGYRERICNGYRIVYRVDTAARLKRLAERFDLVWGTTWEDSANEWIAPLFHLPPLPVCPLDVLRRPLGEPRDDTYKLNDIARYAGERPFAWVDDGIYADGLRWATERSRTVPTLLLRITPVLGLDQRDEDRLITWAHMNTLTHETAGIGTD